MTSSVSVAVKMASAPKVMPCFKSQFGPHRNHTYSCNDDNGIHIDVIMAIADLIELNVSYVSFRKSKHILAALQAGNDVSISSYIDDLQDLSMKGKLSIGPAIYQSKVAFLMCRPRNGLGFLETPIQFATLWDSNLWWSSMLITMVIGLFLAVDHTIRGRIIPRIAKRWHQTFLEVIFSWSRETLHCIDGILSTCSFILTLAFTCGFLKQTYLQHLPNKLINSITIPNELTMHQMQRLIIRGQYHLVTYKKEMEDLDFLPNYILNEFRKRRSKFLNSDTEKSIRFLINTCSTNKNYILPLTRLKMFHSIKSHSFDLIGILISDSAVTQQAHVFRGNPEFREKFSIAVYAIIEGGVGSAIENYYAPVLKGGLFRSITVPAQVTFRKMIYLFRFYCVAVLVCGVIFTIELLINLCRH